MSAHKLRALHPQNLRKLVALRQSWLLSFPLKADSFTDFSSSNSEAPIKELQKGEVFPRTQKKTMCRSTDFEQYLERESLKIKAFYVRFTGLPTRDVLPDSLTLLYPPRINEAAFELDGSKIRPDLPAFVTLHRVVKGGETVYGSRERVRVWEGVRFEVYMKEERVLKGIFRKDEGEKWTLECESKMEEEEGAVEVLVTTEGHVEATVAKKQRRRRRRRMGFDCLEEIPEQREVEIETDGGCCCTCGGEREWEMTAEMDSEIEGMKWAVDLGIWVMCLGVGYLVTRASSKSLTTSHRRRRMFF